MLMILNCISTVIPSQNPHELSYLLSTQASPDIKLVPEAVIKSVTSVFHNSSFSICRTDSGTVFFSHFQKCHHCPSWALAGNMSLMSSLFLQYLFIHVSICIYSNMCHCVCDSVCVHAQRPEGASNASNQGLQVFVGYQD